jgi:hypothetical protein
LFKRVLRGGRSRAFHNRRKSKVPFRDSTGAERNSGAINKRQVFRLEIEGCEVSFSDEMVGVQSFLYRKGVYKVHMQRKIPQKKSILR